MLNFADTFTVARRSDGNCDWSKTPVRTGKPGSSSYLGEARTTECWRVVYTDDSLANVVAVHAGSAPERYWYSFRKRGTEWVFSGKPRPF